MTKDKARSKVIVQSGWWFVLTNLLLAVFNVIVGMISNSIAIISDALHSLIDAVSGVLVVGSEKLASREKLAKHRVKIERVTTIGIALIIVVMGVHIVIESVEKIVEPEEVNYTFATMLVLVVSIAAKYALAVYLKKTGKKVKSEVLVASGAETMNDTWISVAVLVSAMIYLIWQVDIEAYVSIAIAVVVMKVGLEFIFPHISRHHHHHLEQDADHDHCGR